VNDEYKMFVKLKKITQSVAVLALLAAIVMPASPVYASNAPISACPQRVFTFPTWYRGVPMSASCDFKPTKITDLVKIPINILEMLIQAVAYAAAGYILWGGFKYMKSQGDPGKISEAKTAIINALTGLGIALASVAIVEFIQGAVL